jgi:hypothetical protein
VRWNSEAGHVSGRNIKVHTADFDYNEIESDRTEHIAAHRGSALQKVR